MDSYEDIMKSLLEMKSRFDAGFSSPDRNFIEHIYSRILSKKVRKSGCGDCYRDAYLEIYNNLKKLGKMPQNPNYVLKAGIVVHPKGTNRFYANANIPDEIAETYLAEFPSAISKFQTYPSDYLHRIEVRKNGEEPVSSDNGDLAEAYEAAVAKIKSLEGVVADAKHELEQTKDSLAKTTAELESAKSALENIKEESVGDDDGSLSMENETLKSDLASANEEIASLKAQLEDAKSASTPKKRGPKSAE